ncbi:MAG TPA: NepR family anti-sigma factor [Aestuariivirgaceae bacterium]|nr:NepR family anti-sigma factor [Aestuariivirgaceae bacterium]
MDSQTRKHIGRMLKATYDEVAREPVPDKFLDLLKQLEAAEPRKR